jgi:hypothetical protein
MTQRLQKALEVVGDVAGLGMLLIPVVAVIALRSWGNVDWNPYIAGFLIFAAVSEFTKRHTILKRISEDVSSLTRATGKVVAHGSRSEFYRALRRRVETAKIEIYDTTWGPDVPPDSEREPYRDAAVGVAKSVTYREIFSVPSVERLADIHKRIKDRDSDDHSYVIRVRDVPIPDIMVIDEAILMLGLPQIRGKGTGCFLEIENPEIARFFRRFLDDCCHRATRVVLQGDQVVGRDGGRPIAVEHV